MFAGIDSPDTIVHPLSEKTLRSDPVEPIADVSYDESYDEFYDESIEEPVAESIVRDTGANASVAPDPFSFMSDTPVNGDMEMN